MAIISNNRIRGRYPDQRFLMVPPCPIRFCIESVRSSFPSEPKEIARNRNKCKSDAAARFCNPFLLTGNQRGGRVVGEHLLQVQPMIIQINRPEIEALIQQRLHSGVFESVEDVLFDALEIQGEREAWLQENKEAINTKIERGLAQLKRGEAISGDKLRERLEADKAAWLADRSGS